MGILTVIVAFAFASPTDATWISGIYDAADYDDVVDLVSESSGAADGQVASRKIQDGWFPAISPGLGCLTEDVQRVQNTRGPPTIQLRASFR